jgi:hypothetical protein
MKQMPLRPEKAVRGRTILNVFSVLILFSICSSLHAQSLVPELVFMNPQLKTCAGCNGAGADGAVYIFSNVAVGIDALVTIQGRSNPLVTLSTPDFPGPEQDKLNGTGYDNAWQPRVRYANGNAPANSAWWMEFKVSFVKHGRASQSVFVNQFFVSGLGIDGDGHNLHEFQTFYKMQYFTLGENTNMVSSSSKGCLSDPKMNGKRFDGPIKNYPGIATSASDVMVSNFYSNTNSLVVRVGAVTDSGGSSASDRMYSLWFKSLTFDVPESTPLPQTLIASNGQLSDNKFLNF